VNLGDQAMNTRSSLDKCDGPQVYLGLGMASQGAHQIAVEQTEINEIFFGNATSESGNHSYNLSVNNC